jgi:hypothetical protein
MPEAIGLGQLLTVQRFHDKAIFAEFDIFHSTHRLSPFQSMKFAPFPTATGFS